MKKVRIVVADDHAFIREGIKRIIEKTPDIVIVSEAANGQEAIDAVETFLPDFLILDLQMPVLDGFAVIEALKNKGCETKIFILSSNHARDMKYFLDFENVWGYLQKEQAPELLIKGIRRALKEKVVSERT